MKLVRSGKSIGNIKKKLIEKGKISTPADILEDPGTLWGDRIMLIEKA